MNDDDRFDHLNEVVRQMWLDGVSTAKIVRFLLKAAPEPYDRPQDVFRSAFLVSPHSDRTFIFAKDLTDEQIERQLDGFMMEARLGGLLTADRIAGYFRIPNETAAQILADPANRLRVGGRTTYDDDGNATSHELFATSALLRELEDEYLPNVERRYPYWHDRTPAAY